MLERKPGEDFELPVEYNGTSYLLPAQFVQMGYTYRIYVQWLNVEIVFEPDEERDFRAIVEKADDRDINMDLLQAISRSLTAHFR